MKTERLTKKEELPRVPCYVEVQEEHWKTKHRQQAIDKLGQLEDIEEEYCVDLIHFFKAIDGVYVKHNNNIIFISCPDIIFSKTFDVPRIPVAVLEYFINNKKYFKCPCEYGKTWALSKEELE